MIFWIKILLYSNSTSNLIIFFQNPIHSKQKNEEASTAIGIFLQTVSCRKCGKVWWKCRAFEIFFVTLCGFFILFIIRDSKNEDLRLVFQERCFMLKAAATEPI